MLIASPGDILIVAARPIDFTVAGIERLKAETIVAAHGDASPERNSGQFGRGGSILRGQVGEGCRGEFQDCIVGRTEIGEI